MISQEYITEPLPSQIQQYKQKGWVVIEDFLDEALAVSLNNALHTEVPWQYSYLGRLGLVKFPFTDLDALTEKQLSLIEQTVTEVCLRGFQFRYCSANIQNLIATADKSLPTLKLACERVFNMAFTSFLTKLSGNSGISNHNFLASYYPKDGFLMAHNDELKGGNRKLAYVLQLSRNWQKDYGGNLELLDENGKVKEIVVPQFNSLVVFKVPQDHRVSKVVHEGPEKRLAIHGWGF